MLALTVAMFPSAAMAQTNPANPNASTPASPSATSSPDQSAPVDNSADQQVESDPLEPFNSAMFTFNLKVDDWVLHPFARGYAYVIPTGGREAVGRALDNVRFIPRAVNNGLQLRFPEAGGEVARFGINTTVGLLGFFD